jgi:hypothetical protein
MCENLIVDLLWRATALTTLSKALALEQR